MQSKEDRRRGTPRGVDLTLHAWRALDGQERLAPEEIVANTQMTL